MTNIEQSFFLFKSFYLFTPTPELSAQGEGDSPGQGSGTALAKLAVSVHPSKDLQGDAVGGVHPRSDAFLRGGGLPSGQHALDDVVPGIRPYVDIEAICALSEMTGQGGKELAKRRAVVNLVKRDINFEIR